MRPCLQKRETFGAGKLLRVAVIELGLAVLATGAAEEKCSCMLKQCHLAIIGHFHSVLFSLRNELKTIKL